MFVVGIIFVFDPPPPDMSVDPRSHELDFLERKLPVFASRLEDLFLDRDYLAQVQSTALQKTNSALSLTSLSTVKGEC